MIKLPALNKLSNNVASEITRAIDTLRDWFKYNQDFFNAMEKTIDKINTIEKASIDWVGHVTNRSGNPHGTTLEMHPVTGRKIGNGIDYTEFEEDGSLRMEGAATVFDDMLFDIEYEDTDIHPSAGVLGAAAASATGTFQNLGRRNGIQWVITEGGVAGRMMELTFEDVRQVPVMFFTGIYVGTVAHANTMRWQAYNYVTLAWDNLTFTWVNATQFVDQLVTTGFTAQHISAGNQVRIAVNHPSGVSAGHTLSLDEVYLIEDNQPINVFFRGSRVLSFRNNGFDMVHGKIQFRHAYKVASDFYWHVHFTNFQSVIPDGQTIIFQLSKSFSAINYNFPTENTLLATFTNNAAWRATLTAGQAASILSGTNVIIGSHLVAAGASAISGTDLNISSIGMLEIVRNIGTYTDNIGILYSDFHIQQDTLASRQEFIK